MPRFPKAACLLAGLLLVPVALRMRSAPPWRRACPLPAPPTAAR